MWLLAVLVALLCLPRTLQQQQQQQQQQPTDSLSFVFIVGIEGVGHHWLHPLLTEVARACNRNFVPEKSGVMFSSLERLYWSVHKPQCPHFLSLTTQKLFFLPTLLIHSLGSTMLPPSDTL